jgi:hypothetical protein
MGLKHVSAKGMFAKFNFCFRISANEHGYNHIQ